ncbi:neuronal acetylcholine receptor subunit alpha-3-like [Argopecten irradians]|uniref:neuronal acetylcholine receptor subunit alpha-3-like n=1 Tax=Argopecten irradians TaxID=31199 RepID=UPI003722A8C5
MADFKRLTSDIFTNYSVEARPMANLSESVEVYTLFSPLFLLDVNEVSGTITMTMILCMYWMDFQLAWQPSNYGGITDVVVNSSKIWKPYLFVLSSASDMEMVGSDIYTARINSFGGVLWCPGRMITSSCSVDMTRYPADSQNCSVLMLPWGYGINEIKLVPQSRTFYMKMYTPNGEWDIDRTLIDNFFGVYYDTSIIGFSMILTRKSKYFIISMVVPVFILCFLNPFVFLLPAPSGERISYTITMFLSLAVYMTLVGDNMPKVSEPMAGISYFILVSLVFSAAIVMLTIFTLRCEAVTDVTKFPSWLITLLKKKKSLICMFKYKKENKNTIAPSKGPPLDADNICPLPEVEKEQPPFDSMETYYP